MNPGNTLWPEAGPSSSAGLARPFPWPLAPQSGHPAPDHILHRLPAAPLPLCTPVTGLTPPHILPGVSHTQPPPPSQGSLSPPVPKTRRGRVITHTDKQLKGSMCIRAALQSFRSHYKHCHKHVTHTPRPRLTMGPRVTALDTNNMRVSSVFTDVESQSGDTCEVQPSS